MKIFEAKSAIELFAFIALVLSLTKESADASKRCQSIVRRVVIKQCSNQVQNNKKYSEEIESGVGTNDPNIYHGDKTQLKIKKQGKRRKRGSAIDFSEHAGKDNRVNNDLNSSLTNREIFELHKNIYGKRRTRSAEEDKTEETRRRVFLEIASKCCIDESVCMDKRITPCPT